MHGSQQQKQKRGRVIPFERDGEFFLRRGSRRLERNNLLEAINNYHLARAREPENVEIQLAIAEVLTEMHRYEQSNRLLFPLLSTPEKPAECFYGIACNFLGMQDFDHARDSLENYLTADPDGEFVADALELLDILEDDDALYTMPGVLPKEEWDTMQACTLSRQLIELGRAKEAVEMMEARVRERSDVAFLRNHLALAYFCNKNYGEAMREVSDVLEVLPNDVQANSNLLLFRYAARDHEGVEKCLQFLDTVETDDPNDWNRLAVVFMETGRMKEAMQMLKKLQRLLPYEENTLHRLGACQYHCAQYKSAMECYDKLLKIDPNDTVAAYYRKICYRATRGTPEKVEWRYHYQVPFKEFVHRIRIVHDIGETAQESSARRWQEDAKFRAQLTWCLCLPDDNAKRAMLRLIAGFGGYEAEQVLRHFLLDTLQPDIVKQDVFAMLKQMDAREPYIAYIDGRLVQSRVRVRFTKNGANTPVSYMRVYQLMMDQAPVHCSIDQALYAVELLERYTTEASPLPALRPPQIPAMAAAFEYLARKNTKESISQSEAAGLYGVSLIRVRNAVSRIREGLKEE